MCNFFSAISNGKGETLFFRLEDIVNQIAIGNPKEYDWNSHTSIASFHGIEGIKEDKWNKWEYNIGSKELILDMLNVKNDKIEVKKKIEEYLKDKSIAYIRNLYNRNSGDWNSGNQNSGNWNSGNQNSGNWNSGDWNSGNQNSGDWNSGNWNSGNQNSGDWNSGNWNSGFLNTNNPDRIRIFNSWIDQKDFKEIQWPDFFYFNLTTWVSHDTATQEEKKKYKTEIEICGGFLKKIDYKDAWKLSYKKATKEYKAKVKKIPGFNAKLFEENTGIKVE